MEQRVYFDNEGKLQITTDNGKIMDNGATTQTKIEGTFTIQAQDVARLITHFSGKVTCTKETFFLEQIKRTILPPTKSSLNL